LLAINKGWSHVVFEIESDSQLLVCSIHASSLGASEFNSIISSIRSILSHYPNFEVKFVWKQMNMVSHSLARVAIAWASHRLFEAIPLCLY
jgi:hypothetical protein